MFFTPVISVLTHAFFFFPASVQRRIGEEGGGDFKRGESCNLNLKDEKCVVERA